MSEPELSAAAGAERRWRHSAPSRFPCIPGTRIEIVAPPVTGRVAHVLFDFDGTVSLLRDGWQDVMVPMMVDVLMGCPRHEGREEIETQVIDFVDHLTGKQTIYQMLRLVEEVKRRGGRPLDATEYKAEYHRRLDRYIESRLEALRSGAERREKFLVPGALPLLDELKRRGLRCYVASGTDIEYVKEEVRLLGLEAYFEDRVYGALPNYKEYSKEIVIRRILSEFGLAGPELLVIGDGYVEIQNGRDVDAVTWGVYTPEGNRYHMNENKRGRLFRAGAHLLSEDLSEYEAALRYLKIA